MNARKMTLASSVSVREMIKWYFHVLIALRFSSEYFDSILGTHFSQIITSQFILLYAASYFLKSQSLTPALRRIIFFMSTFMLSAVVSWQLGDKISNYHAIIQIFRYISYIAVLYLGFVLYREFGEYKGLFISIIIGVIPSILFSLYQAFSASGFTDYGAFGHHRVYGFATHPVLFGVQLVIVLSLLFALSRRIKISLGTYLLSVVVTLFAIAAIYLTFSRTAWVMLLLIFFIIMFRYGGIIGWFFILLLISFTFFLPHFHNRFEDLSTINEFIASGSIYDENYGRQIDSSVHWRIYHWHYMIVLAQDSLTFGFGPGMSEQLSPFSRDSHSTVIDILVEQGVVGLLVFCVIIHSIYKMGNGLRIAKCKCYEFLLINSTLLSLLLALLFSISLQNQTFNMILVMLLIAIRAKLYANN